MASDFGRKDTGQQGTLTAGLVRRAPHPAARPGSKPVPADYDPYEGDLPKPSGALQAFIAGERQRREAEGDGGGLSDVAMAFGGRAARVETGSSGGIGGAISRRVASAPQPRSLGVAYLLWFFLGPVGAHRFYLRAFPTAFIQLGVTLFFIFAIGALEATVFFPAGLAVISGLLLDAILMPWLVRDCNAKIAAG